ncbi:MAG TPA: transglutaminase family protein [Ktedonobacteraceae bacterium]|nr:transglutaminase family protein [Ktedonobacteraceae bacterium]
MGKKHVLLLLTLTALVVLSGIYIAGGVQAYARYQQSSLQKQEYCGGQAPVHICVHAPTAIFSAFYPSYLATQYPLFTIDYSSSSPLTLVISVSIAHFSQSQTQTVSATDTLQSSTFVPPLQDQALRNLTTEKSESLHVQVTDTRGHLYYLNDTPVTLHSRWLMQWVAANRLKVAAWVTPNDPAVVALVTRAASHLQEQQPPAPAGMVGYRSATAQQVIDQVDAIYDTLRLDYHIQYLQASVPYSGTDNDSTATQNIKLPAEVLQQRSGMCVELTTLLAAAVEQIGLNAEIVIIPGHAFLGVAVTEGATDFEYWDGVDVNNNVAADSANVAADSLYQKNLNQHTIIDTILISEARNAHIGPML